VGRERGREVDGEGADVKEWRSGAVELLIAGVGGQRSKRHT